MMSLVLVLLALLVMFAIVATGGRLLRSLLRGGGTVMLLIAAILAGVLLLGYLGWVWQLLERSTLPMLVGDLAAYKSIVFVILILAALGSLLASRE